MLMSSRMRVLTTVVLHALVCIAFLGLGPPGCTTATTGPRASQGLDGQTLANAGGDSLTVMDRPDGEGKGTTTIAGSGPLFVANQDAQTNAIRSSGMVSTQIVIRDPGGAELSAFSGQNLKGTIAKDAATGNVTSVTFESDSEKPLKALADVQAVKAELEKIITAENSAVLRTISENQKATIIGVVEKIEPTLAAALRAKWPTGP